MDDLDTLLFALLDDVGIPVDEHEAGVKLLRGFVTICDARYQPRADAPCRHGTNSCRLRGLEHDRDRCIVSGQPRADVKPAASKPAICHRCKRPEATDFEHPHGKCFREYAYRDKEAERDCDREAAALPVPPDVAPAPDDATEEAAKIMASAMGYAETVHAIAAALRRRSEVRIGTGAIARTLLHETPDICQWFGSREPDGHAQIEWRTQERAAGMAIDLAAYRALVALMARDGEGR